MDAYEATHIRAREQLSRPAPPILFKYVKFEIALAIFSGLKLQFASPLTFNDPFDTQWNILWPTETPDALEYEFKELKDILRNPAGTRDHSRRPYLEQLGKALESLSGSDREAAIRDYQRRIHQNKRAGRSPHFLEPIQRSMRMLCLSEPPDSILMWSHYAENHRGAVLGFEVRALEEHWGLAVNPVSYSDEFPAILRYKQFISGYLRGLPDSGDMERDGRGWALTKHRGWEYEKEWRFVRFVVSDSPDLRELVSFPASALRELHIGCKVLDADAEMLHTAAITANPSIRACRLSPHQSRFALEPDLSWTSR